MRTSDQKQNKGLDTESGVQQVLAKTTLFSLSFSLVNRVPFAFCFLFSPVS